MDTMSFTMQDAQDEKWVDHPKFWEGYKDGKAGRQFKEYDNVDGQAYDRGYDLGVHLPKPRFEHWGNDPNIGETVGLN
jgi:hypothetical protein